MLQEDDLRRSGGRARAASAGTSLLVAGALLLPAAADDARRRRRSGGRRHHLPDEVQQREGQVRPDDAVLLPAAQRSDQLRRSVDGTDPPTFAAVNDLDAVAAATPAYGAPRTTAPGRLPATLPPGEYTLMVEVNKEFDTNAVAPAPRLRRRPPGRLRHRAATSASRRSFTRFPSTSTCHDGGHGRGAVVADHRLRRLDGRDGPHQFARRRASRPARRARARGGLLPISSTAAGQTGRVLASVAPCFVVGPTNMCSICDPAKQECTPLTCSPPPALPGAVSGLARDRQQRDGHDRGPAVSERAGRGRARAELRQSGTGTGPTMTDDQFAFGRRRRRRCMPGSALASLASCHDRDP